MRNGMSDAQTSINSGKSRLSVITNPMNSHPAIHHRPSSMSRGR